MASCSRCSRPAVTRFEQWHCCVHCLLLLVRMVDMRVPRSEIGEVRS